MNWPPFWTQSARIGRQAHDRILRSGRRKSVRRSRYHNPAQLVLDLERQTPEPSLMVSPKGPVEALADLLLEALGVESLSTKGGADDRQDHA